MVSFVKEETISSNLSPFPSQLGAALPTEGRSEAQGTRPDLVTPTPAREIPLGCQLPEPLPFSLCVGPLRGLLVLCASPKLPEKPASRSA